MMTKMIFLNNKYSKLVRFIFLIVCVLMIIYDPIDRFISNSTFYLGGYKPLLINARDNIWLVSGIIGATVSIFEKDNAYGLLLMNVCALGFILSAIIEEIFNILYHQNLYFYGVVFLLSILVFLFNTFQIAGWSWKKTIFIMGIPSIIAVGISLVFIYLSNYEV